MTLQVTDALTGEPIIGAVVKDSNGKTYVTNESGICAIKLSNSGKKRENHCLIRRLQELHFLCVSTNTHTEHQVKGRRTAINWCNGDSKKETHQHHAAS